MLFTKQQNDYMPSKTSSLIERRGGKLLRLGRLGLAGHME
jgi:hypothetical protein